jgi:hypothetical protein
LEVAAQSYDDKTITVTNKNGDIIKIDASEAYAAGWKKAYGMYNYGMSGNVITVKGPSSTVDVAATDRTYTITAGADCSVTASETSVTYTSNGKKNRTANASGTATGYAYIDGIQVATATDTAKDDVDYTVTVAVPTTPSTT